MHERISPQEREIFPSHYALILSGQGNTSVGAGLPEYSESGVFRSSFDRYDSFIKENNSDFSLKELCFQDPDSMLSSTYNTHLAITSLYLAKYNMLKEEYNISEPQFIAGQSAAECAAIGIAGVVDEESALYIAAGRGKFTQEAGEKNPSSMMAFLYSKPDVGLEELEEICQKTLEENDGVVAVTNINSPYAYIVGGNHNLVEHVAENASGARRKIPLAISFASHCALMEEAREQFEEFLRPIPFNQPEVPLVINGRVLRDPGEIKRQMSDGLIERVDWSSSVERMNEKNIGAFVELSTHSEYKAPLSKFAERINPDIKTFIR